MRVNISTFYKINILMFFNFLIFFNCIGCTTTESDSKIQMPNDAEYYIGSEWDIDSLTKHFEELGFTNISTIPCEPDDNNYKINIQELYIKTGIFNTDPWKSGEEYNSDAEISIYYNESPLLTVENCPDLVTVLTSKNMDYVTFCEKYDGRYVEFNAYVTSNIVYLESDHIIDVTGGDYDGIKELGHYDDKYYEGLIIRIGDRAFNNNINNNVKEGDNVLVSGKISSSWADYYKCLYVETLLLENR